MTAIEVACPVCAQQPYELCRMPDGSTAPFTHAERLEFAASESSPSTNDPLIVDEAIKAAVDELI